MYEEMVFTVKLTPSLYQIRRLYREGFIDMDGVEKHLEEIRKLPDLTQARLYALKLEREYEVKDLMLDVITRALGRGALTPDEARRELRELGLPTDLADLHIARERLGLLRRPRIEAPPPIPVIEVIPEEEG